MSRNLTLCNPASQLTAAEAVRCIKSGDRVYIQGMAAAPQCLIRAMADRAPELRAVEVLQLHTEGPAPYAERGMEASFRVRALFVGANLRDAVNEGRADYVPIFLSEAPSLLSSGALPIDVAMIHVSPPDRNGYCSLGTSVDLTRTAVKAAKRVIAQVNRFMPRTHGDGFVHMDDLDALVYVDERLPEIECRDSTEKEQLIGQYCATLVEDGATLQMGIGAIPNAVLTSLRGHANLGVHSEMISDGIVDLIERGVVNGTQKRTHPGKVVAGFALGTRRLYDFIDDNPVVAMLDIGYVNDPDVIRRNPKVTAINSAIEVDLTGQVCADSIGNRIFSGVGGQMDFMRGAAQSEGGKPIIALPSTTRHGESRIASVLKPGAGVVTTRAHVHYVVTEYGIASLHGRCLRERAKLLIDIAHPDHRERLEREAHELLRF
ncbi:acetyl-CoA hydrolase/transferase family protein [Fimbriimonas ginsengisoli]|uniref:4-hydroxybutyrate coenzyme A transferase n=1 Tax=Fimbriimonas ginsengisoli Gsoil 348 TaxID=661478 RepID=A0A068NT59_FIMGI|nr:acetyl-CoA hydrolase/transferase C-terminal domain-containing protein [Fimbriimonas ginsengisoli]AIE86591.1 4-hydroxybutyrate coenzyme A transferase [Fimbriimonas ginsengisoli Gsoil 348]